MQHLQTLYNEGASVLQIAKILSVSRPLVMRRLVELGLPIRSASEANKLRMGRMDQSERLALASAAHAAVRGSTRPHEELVRRAMQVQRENKMSALERKCHRELSARGINTLPLMAIDKYNVDLGYLPAKVAIEVHCDFHTEQRKALQDARKLRYLAAAEWFPVYLHEKTLSSFTFDSVVALCKYRASIISS